MANLSGEEEPAEIERRTKKCPNLTVQELLIISQLFQISPMVILKGAEKLYDFPLSDTIDEIDRKIEAIKKGIDEMNDKGVQKLYNYMTDLLKIEEYRK